MKTRRTKRNKSPIRPYKRAKAMVAIAGDMVTTRGVRGRTVVKRIEDGTGKRLKTARLIAPAVQLPSPQNGTPIFVGRVYTGVAKGKKYPAHGPRRYPPAAGSDAPKGFLGGLTKRVKTALTGV